MNISGVSIHRPVLATVINVFIVLFGIIGFTYLGIREFPSVDPPVVTVTTNYSGANADVIESQITEPLEESINGIAGIRNLTSISSEGRSNITVEFELGVDLEAAANDVRDKVSRAVRNLPSDADPPVVVKSDADAETILSITVQSDKRDLLELSAVGNNIFKERMQTIPGVSEIRIWGEKKYSMKLEIDPNKLAGYELTPLDIRNALDKENVELPSGRVEGNETELTIRTFGRLTTVEDFNNLIVSENNGVLVRFKDVGKARLLPENERTLLRGDGGIPMIGIAITPQPGTNYIEIADRAYERVEQIKKELPEDYKIGVALDTTRSIRTAITEVQETIIIAFLLVVLVISIFLRNWRTTLIPVIAIPISLIGGFFIMYLLDYSINLLTLLGLVLATGLVVDDAIVVMENIYSKVEKGVPPMEAGIQGSKEIFFAVISTTITLTAVFLPIIFLEGLTGRLFREFGMVVAGTVIISTIVSLTLTPMMSSRILRKSTWQSPFLKKTDAFFDGLNNVYKKSLHVFMHWPKIAWLVVVVSGVAIFWLGNILPSELAPMEDKSRLRIVATAPEGVSYELMDRYVQELVSLTDTLPEKESLLSVTSPGFGSSININSGFVRLTLVDPKDRRKSQQQLAGELTKILSNYSFARTYVVQDQTIGGGRLSGLPVQFVLQAPNFGELKEALPRFMDSAMATGQFEVMDVNLKFNKPELKVTINREKAQSMGVSVRDIAQTMQLLFSQQRFGYFIKDGKQYQVIGQASRNNRNEPSDLSSVYVRNKNGDQVQLADLVDMEAESSPPQLHRYNRFVSATVSARPIEGKTLGDGIETMESVAKKVLNDRFSTDLSGTSKEYRDSSGNLMFAFLLALVLIYLVLAAQFESFRDPLTIMITVPLALAGALLSLWLFGQTLNIFSEIGIIVLVGIVTKNGILIVEFANQKKQDGLNTKEAVMEAAVQRFRPILMTSLATILGALPIALALGDAATSRIPMGIAIIGGLIFSLGLTLYVIPAVYLFITSKRARLSEMQKLTYEE
ncbi:MAG: MMPL family transporter [Bacteroidetes bacterium]|nr:MMPL family transporter [Bacteroidota bacterium]